MKSTESDFNSKELDKEIEESLNKEYERIDAEGKLGGVLFSKLIAQTNDTIDKINQNKKEFKEKNNQK